MGRSRSKFFTAARGPGADQTFPHRADADERAIERIEARILADYQEKADADAFDEAYAARDRVAGGW